MLFLTCPTYPSRTSKSSKYSQHAQENIGVNRINKITIVSNNMITIVSTMLIIPSPTRVHTKLNTLRLNLYLSTDRAIQYHACYVNSSCSMILYALNT